MNNQKTPWDLDIRVRERNLAKGILDAKDVDRYLKDLPDAAANAESIPLDQPALEPADDEDDGDEDVA
jgi:hypothetical protein